MFAAAHRGLSSVHAENTVAAFQGAAAAGFPCIELDVRITHDGHVVCIHDAGIDRTTDGNGRVADFDYAELATYHTGEGPVPRLADALAALDGWQGSWNIEVKAHAAALPALKLLEAHDLLDRVQLSSLDPRALKVAKEEYPDVPRGLITLGPPDEDDLDLAVSMGCRWLNADHEFLTSQVIEDARAKDLLIGAWTVNDVDEAKALVERGVDCIITDLEEVLRAVPGQAAF